MRPLSLGRACLVIFVVSLGLRSLLLFSWMVPHELVHPTLMGEVGKTARSLAFTGHYADPYLIPTGPTAHPLPIHTGIIAIIFRLVGLTETAGYARCLFSLACFSAMYALLPWIALRLGIGRTAGWIAGLAGAIYPGRWLGETFGWSGDEALAAIAVGVLAAACVRRWTATRIRALGSILLGSGFGLAFHLAPAILPVMLGWLIFEIRWRKDRRRWRNAGLVLACAAIACVPWTLRNHAAFDRFVFIRSNFGLELRIGNHEGAAAQLDTIDLREGVAMRHPSRNVEEARLVQALGEIEYMRRARLEALEWIRDHPARFAYLAAARFVHFWAGPLKLSPEGVEIFLIFILALLGLRRVLPHQTAPQRAAMLIPLAAYPIVYYVVSYSARYTIPVSWIPLLLAAAEIHHRFRRR